MNLNGSLCWGVPPRQNLRAELQACKSLLEAEGSRSCLFFLNLGAIGASTSISTTSTLISSCCTLQNLYGSYVVG